MAASIYTNTGYGSIPSLPAYTTDTSTTTGTDIQAQMLKNLPGYANLSAADSSNIGGNLAGTLSPDVIAQMQQAGAERGIATGTEGSGSNNAAYLKALGLTSMQLQQLGHTQLTEAMGRTPIQQTQLGTQKTDQGAAAAVYASAPNPALMQQASMNAAGAGMGAGRTPLNPQSGTQAMGFQSPNYTNPAAVGATGLDALQKPGYTFDNMTGQYTQAQTNPYAGGNLMMGQGQGTPYSGSIGGYGQMQTDQQMQNMFPEWYPQGGQQQDYSQYNYAAPVTTDYGLGSALQDSGVTDYYGS
jgi:hypothetical protein